MSFNVKIIFIIMGLIVGNFLYQIIGEGNYSIAFERSYFQAFALGCIYFWTVIGEI